MNALYARIKSHNISFSSFYFVPLPPLTKVLAI